MHCPNNKILCLVASDSFPKMTSHMLYLSHLDSKNVFTSNTPKDFTVEFTKSIELKENATVELMEFRCYASTKSKLTFYVMSDICDYSIANNMRLPILRCIAMGGKQRVEQSFSKPYKILIRDRRLTRCRIYLRDENLKDPSLHITEAQVTLRINNVCNQ